MKIDGDIGAKKILKLNENKIFKLNTSDQSITVNFNTKSSFT